MKLFKAFLAILPWNCSMAMPKLNDNVLSSDPLLHYATVGYLHDSMSAMRPQQKAVLIQKIKNRNAAQLRKMLRLLIVKGNPAAMDAQKQRKKNRGNKYKNRFNRYKKYHRN